jgi:hypothetical protein
VTQSRHSNSRNEMSKDGGKSKFSIPTGSHGFIEIPLEKKFVIPFRIVMILIALPFALEAYNVVTTGVADRGIDVVSRGEHWGYYAHLAKHASFALLFLWLGSFGVRDKATAIRADES